MIDTVTFLRGLFDGGAPADRLESLPDPAPVPADHPGDLPADHPKDERFEERAAIIEFDAGFSRQEAERLALADVGGLDPDDPAQAPEDPDDIVYEDPVPCPKCGELDTWFDPLDGRHCLACEPPVVAQRLRERAAGLRVLDAGRYANYVRQCADDQKETRAAE